ncbi:polyprenyl synthetase family protein [bacterium]|nr:polyprenyl synthetase family protein [candidate division CSSED10-310 bacterium]
MEGTGNLNVDHYRDMKKYLGGVAGNVRRIIEEHPLTERLAPAYFKDGVMLYPRRGGKALRPGLLLAAARIMGGEDEGALLVGAAVEMFHIFTLVHDDIIDCDELRRGGPSNHVFFRSILAARHDLAARSNDQLGEALAILAGDVQHAFAVSLITAAARRRLVASDVALHLLDELEVNVLTPLVEGQVLDLMLAAMPLADVTEDAVTDMLWKKTGVLFQFALTAGAMIGMGSSDATHPIIATFTRIGRLFGIGFQLMDDLLGLLGKKETFGKPIGSDLIEGKRTPIVLHAYDRASNAEKRFIESILGNPGSTVEQREELTGLLIQLGGPDHARRRMREHLEQCRELISGLPAHPMREMLMEIAEYAGTRDK